MIWRKLRWSPPWEEASESNDMVPEIFPASCCRRWRLGLDSSAGEITQPRLGAAAGGSENDVDDEEAERKRAPGARLPRQSAERGKQRGGRVFLGSRRVEEVVGRHRLKEITGLPLARYCYGHWKITA